jgi:hypothetical protein
MSEKNTENYTYHIISTKKSIFGNLNTPLEPNAYWAYTKTELRHMVKKDYKTDDLLICFNIRPDNEGISWKIGHIDRGIPE